MHDHSAEGSAPTRTARAGRWNERRFELVLALLLGAASIITAWASFQASLYDGRMAAANTQAGVLAAEAESLYLENNQQYASDAELFGRLTELEVQSRSADPAAAAVAVETLELLKFQSLTDTFAAAIDWAAAENDADPSTFTHPQQSEAYEAALFTEYDEKKAAADAALTSAATFNELGDQLTLATVLLAISLFLFGIAAILRAARLRLILVGVSTAVMIAATVMSVIVVLTPTGSAL